LQKAQGWGTLCIGDAGGKQKSQYPDPQRLARAQEIVRSKVPRTVSLVDELIEERREEARNEQLET
jgi:hypothetical protein